MHMSGVTVTEASNHPRGLDECPTEEAGFSLY